jgi:predicted phage replisome organizer
VADNKKFYWLKLKRDFFKRHDIRIIETMPNGKDYILFYLKLLLESIDHEGELRFSETIPYNEQMLSVITDTNVDIVKSAMKVFIELNMIEIFDDNTIFMQEVTKLIGSETKGAERVREHRKKQKALQCNTSVTKCNTEIDIDKEIQIDTESKKENNKPVRHKYGEYKNVLLTDDDLDKLKAKFPTDWEERIENLSEGIELKGYKYKNHYLAICKWAKNDKPVKEQPKQQSDYDKFMGKLQQMYNEVDE